MTAHQEYQYLLAELTTLKEMLDEIPEADIIVRLSLEGRMEVVKERLASYGDPPKKPIEFRLTFRGAPTVERYGIRADFGGNAMKYFTDAVAAVGFSQTRTLGEWGVIPNRDMFNLVITGTARGSFGFVLEEGFKDENISDAKTSVESAINTIIAILKASTGTNDELNEALSETDPRAIKEIHAFVKHLADNDAVCTLQSEKDVFSFSDIKQIRQSEKNLSEDNIHEEQIEFNGYFIGYLPEKRVFEFYAEDMKAVISGKVDVTVENPEKINDILKKQTHIRLRMRRVGVSRQATYTLLTYELKEDL